MPSVSPSQHSTDTRAKRVLLTRSRCGTDAIRVSEAHARISRGVCPLNTLNTLRKRLPQSWKCLESVLGFENSIQMLMPFSAFRVFSVFSGQINGARF